MICKFHRDPHPLDVKVSERAFSERAFDEAWTTSKESETAIESECDQALETALRRDLIEIARLYGATEPDALRVPLAGSPCVHEAFPSLSASDQS